MRATPPEGTVTVTHTNGLTVTIAVGAVVTVRWGASDCYGAVVSRISGFTVHLTFTPYGKPRSVPADTILASALPPAGDTVTLDPCSVPRHQPRITPTIRRRKGEG